MKPPETHSSLADSPASEPKKLRADYFGYKSVCTVCHRTKQPRGRSAPMEMRLCDYECPGYRREPLPSELWPNESEADFGYGVSR